MISLTCSIAKTTSIFIAYNIIRITHHILQVSFSESSRLITLVLIRSPKTIILPTHKKKREIEAPKRKETERELRSSEKSINYQLANKVRKKNQRIK